MRELQENKFEKYKHELIELRLRNLTQKQIAKKLDLTQNEVKSMLQKLIKQNVISRKRTVLSIDTLQDFPFFITIGNFRNFIELWHVCNNEQLSLHYNLHPLEIAKITNFIRSNLIILKKDIKHLKENPLILLNKPEADFIFLIRQRYSKQEIANSLDMTLAQVNDTIKWLNTYQNEAVRAAVSKPPVRLDWIKFETIKAIYYNFNDYEAASILSIGHSSFGRLTKRYREERKLLPKKEYRRKVANGELPEVKFDINKIF